MPRRYAAAATSTCRICCAAAPTVGPLYENPGAVVVAASRRGVGSCAVDGRTSVRGGYGLYFNTNNQQNLIVTVTNPPATPRVVIANPTFPVPPFERDTGISVRPIQYDVRVPARAHVERQRAAGAVVGLGGDDRRRGIARPASVAQFRSERPDTDDADRRHAVLSRRGCRARTPASRRSK